MPLSKDQLPYSTRRVGKEGCRMKTDRDMQLTPELFYTIFSALVYLDINLDIFSL